MELKNRAVMAPMGTRLCSENGAVTQKLVDFYLERAKGGIGLIITENTCVEWPRGKAGPKPLRLDDWPYVQGLAEIAEAVHPYGAKVATQLQHVGRQGNVEMSTSGTQLVAPSAVPCTVTGGSVPRSLTLSEIKDVIGKFVKAAIRTKAAGFDAVELHGAHGYLITQFMSPYTNKRRDGYGGSFERRMRFPVEIVEGIKAELGKDFPVIFRLSGDEYVEGGYRIEDAIKIVETLESAGVDAIDVSAGIYESMPYIFPVYDLGPGCHLPLAKAIKTAVDIPIIVAGRLGENIEIVEKAIREEYTDFIALGRSLLADPHLLLKIRQQKSGDIRPCMNCLSGCVELQGKGWRIHCAVNPKVGNEGAYQTAGTRRKKALAVIGGGPAGIHAAIVSSRLGHKVTLYEKGDALGGQLIPASTPAFKKPVWQFLDYLRTQVGKSRVTLALEHEITSANLEELRSSDLIILASGGIPLAPSIPGLESLDPTFAADVLAGAKEVGNEAVIIGGGVIGCELAWHLAGQGVKVTILEKLDQVLNDTCSAKRMLLLARLRETGVDVFTNCVITRVLRQQVVSDVGAEGEREFTGSIVLAMGYVKEQETGRLVRRGLPNVPTYLIGDCRKVDRKVWGAISDADWIARHIEEFVDQNGVFS